MESQNIVIALPLEDKLLTPFYEWGKKFDFSHVDTVHFIHVVKKNITPLEFGLVESPDQGTYREMTPTLEKFLRDESKKILPVDFAGNVDFLVNIDFNPEEQIVDYLKRIHASLLVVATRGIHGLSTLFHHSFTDFMIKHAPCDVFVVRPHEELRKSA